MGAGCYLCESGYGYIPDTAPGDAVGACKLCGVLACLAHGVRNKSRPAYVCGCCVPNLLAAAAALTLPMNPPGGVPPPTGQTDHGEPPGDQPSSFVRWTREVNQADDVIGDLAEPRWEQLRDRMAYFSRWLAGAEAPAILRGYSHPGAEQARILMAAAIAFASELELPGHELLPALQEVLWHVQHA